MLRHIITNEELAKKDICYSDFGIRLELREGKKIYFDKTGIAIQMEDGTYLTAADLQRHIMAHRKSTEKSEEDHRMFGGEGP